MAHYTYNRHRKSSYTVTDRAELVEMRARQRTLEGAYSRTALMIWGTAVLFIKLFDPGFYDIGVLFIVLGALLSVAAWFRGRHLNRDFSDQNRPVLAISTSHVRLFGAPFVTAGWIVVLTSLLVLSSHVVLIVLLLKV